MLETENKMKRVVILFNLGGPDKLESVEPFLFNLFNDPAIISIPSFFRYPLAKLISKRRAPIAKNIYKEIGNKSPILILTQEQAKICIILAPASICLSTCKHIVSSIFFNN